MRSKSRKRGLGRAKKGLSSKGHEMAATVLPEDDDLCMTPVAMRLRGLAVLPDLAHLLTTHSVEIS